MNLSDKRVIVCCGAGGVGKTTTAASLAVGAARSGRKVLVLTIDPSRRLAETLGVSRNTPEPVPLDRASALEAGIEGKGSLSAWMLDPRLVSDRTVRALSPSPEMAERLMHNRIYQQVTRMVAGMQEYTAMEALHGFLESGRYDLVILDTPPARNALNFLEAPGRLARFFDGSIFQLLLPGPKERRRSMTRRIIDMILAGVFGEEFYNDLQVFFGSFEAIFATLNGNAQRMRERLKEDDVAFLMVTSPTRSALDDTLRFEERIQQIGLPLGGFVLNRCRAAEAGLRLPDESLLPPDATPAHHSAIEKLRPLAEAERRAAEVHAGLLAELAGEDRVVLPVPELSDAADDLQGLARLSTRLWT